MKEEGGDAESEPARDGGANETGAEDEGADARGVHGGVAEGEGAGEGFGDEDEVFIGGELGVDQRQEIVVAKGLMRGVGDDAGRLIGRNCVEQRVEKIAGAVEAGEKDEGRWWHLVARARATSGS